MTYLDKDDDLEDKPIGRVEEGGGATLSDRIAKLRELDAKRTPGRWSNMVQAWDDDAGDFTEQYEPELRISLGESGIIYDEGGHTVEDASFICALANEALPIITELQAENAKLRDAVQVAREALG